MKKKKEEPKFKVTDHILVPQHVLLSKEEAKKVLRKYNAEPHQFPKILATDPCVKLLGAKPGNMLKIIRSSPTAGETIAYRIVVGG
jgi:DNA-directed RNA polymerase subunit H